MQVETKTSIGLGGLNAAEIEITDDSGMCHTFFANYWREEGDAGLMAAFAEARQKAIDSGFKI